MTVREGDVRQTQVCAAISRTRIVQYAAASGDFSSLHVDEPAALAAGHSSVMAHGMLTLSLSANAVSDWFGTASIRSLRARFTAPVWPGDTLTTTVTVDALEPSSDGTTAALSLRTETQDQRLVLAGQASVRLTPETE